MQFPFSLFGDLLAEFQKYLTGHIARPVYWATGLVVAALSLIACYLIGWSAFLDVWNKTDIFLKLILSGAMVVTFLLLAYLLGRLQSTVERWFQGELPRRLQIHSLERHRAIWQKHQDTTQKMSDLYGKLHDEVKEMTQWGSPPDTFSLVLRTTRPLPPYSFITEKDLEDTEIHEAPFGALHDKQATVGMMALHPIDADTIITSADVLHLPTELEHAEIASLSVSAQIIPAGLLPGDLVVIYAQAPENGRVIPFKPSLILAIQHLPGGETNKAKADLVQFTLAIASNDIEAFVVHSGSQILRVVRPMPQVTPALQATRNLPAPPTIASVTISSAPIVDQIEVLEKEYGAGKQWLKRLRTGTVAAEIPPYRDTLNETFTQIDKLPATTSQKQQETWLQQVNDYRNKWIRLLEEAYKEMEYRTDQRQKIFPLYLYYPSTIERVAPSAIGNVFSAVDSYCDRLYGIDIALVLPRLHAVMEKSTRDQLTKAHDQLELFEWLYLGSIAVGIIGTFMACYAQHYLLALLLWPLALPVPHFILYPAALKAALDYAAALRLAIDTERGKIIKKAGFSLPSPTNQEQEKALWKQIQQWWMYGISPGDYTLTMEGTGNETKHEKTT